MAGWVDAGGGQQRWDALAGAEDTVDAVSRRRPRHIFDCMESAAIKVHFERYGYATVRCTHTGTTRRWERREPVQETTSESKNRIETEEVDNGRLGGTA